MKQKTTIQADNSKLVEDVEWRGCPSPAAYLEVKALMGDLSDEIPGVGGIGEKGAFDLVRQFGTVRGFFEAVEIHQVKVPKKLATSAPRRRSGEIFYRKLRIMDLMHNDIPGARAAQAAQAGVQPGRRARAVARRSCSTRSSTTWTAGSSRFAR